MPPRSASLARRYPARLDVPLLLILSGGLLYLGLTTPAVETRALLFWRSDYSILVNVLDLSREGKRIAATVLALTAVAYPVCKLLVLLYFWLMPFPHRWRLGAIRFLRWFGRWSMADVFAIATILLASRTIGPLDASPRAGLYFYAGSILLLTVASLLMDRLARRGRK